MAQDFGILISQPGTSVTDANPSSAKMVMNTAHPFIKIDTQNTNGFLTLTLSIVNDPPEPAGVATDSYTALYSFMHGYKYIPSPEVLFNVTNFAPGLSGGMAYFLESGFLGGHTVFDGAYLYAVADATKVYIVCHKYKDAGAGGLSNTLTGTNVTITTHVFVDDIGV
jgi:hypothetical protein